MYCLPEYREPRDSNKCIKCPEGVSDCFGSDEVKVNTCHDNYYYNYNKCHKCNHEGIRKCDGIEADNAKDCSDGFYEDETTCLPCGSHIRSCN